MVAPAAGRATAVRGVTSDPDGMNEPTFAVGRLVNIVDFLGMQLDPTSGGVAVILRERKAPGRVVPIVVGGAEAVSIAMALSDDEPARPMSHDLMASLIDGTGARVDAVEVTEVRDGAYIAEVAVSGPVGDVRIDSRPSDAIALALRVDAELYVSEAVLDAAGIVVTEVPGEDEIAAELEAFRAELDVSGIDAFLDDALDGDTDDPEHPATDG